MKLFLTKSNLQTVELNIDFPAFYKWGGGFYKITSLTSYIEVQASGLFGETYIKVNENKKSAEHVLAHASPATEEEYENAYDRAFSYISKVVCAA